MTRLRWDAAPQRIVGIGTSAGGLEALKLLVSGLQHDSGLSFVILQHLPPAQTGALATLLAPHSSLPVCLAGPRHRPMPDTIVIVPAMVGAEIQDGAIELRPLEGGRSQHPIDLLFASLAQVAGDAAIGIVLSGTGSDGTYGLRQILAAGGSTIVQEPATARFDEMPRSAIAMNAATLVLAPGDIGRELASSRRDDHDRQRRRSRDDIHRPVSAARFTLACSVSSITSTSSRMRGVSRRSM